MKHLIYLSWLFFISEFLLMLVKRSSKSTTRQRGDRGSLILLWVIITVSFTSGFIFANYRVWNSLNYTIATFGLFLILVGFVIRWISILQLKKAFTVDVAIGTDHKLKTNGMYRVIRHPSYLGLFIIMVGFSICMNTIVSFLVVTTLMFIALMYRIYVEEKALSAAFGEDFTAYKSKTKRLIPWIF